MPGAHDESFLRAALALARRGLGRTAPNPSVAALVVDESGAVPIVLGRGVTAPGGRPHAEPLALAEAGEAARGATLYVTLEPCAERSVRYDGPSCTDHILDAGISRVVIAANDPSPFAAGRYRARLEAAGVRVETGLLAPEAHRLNLGHYLARTAFRPFVSVPAGHHRRPGARPRAPDARHLRCLAHRYRHDSRR